MTAAPSSARRYFIIGGAGFIGGHFSDYLLAQPTVERVTVYDNFSSGREWHVATHHGDPRFAVVREDVRNVEALTAAMEGTDTVIHLASNPDIAAAATNPMVDFDQGTLLTQNVVEAMRRTGTRQILYASGSGVYGDLGEREADENFGPLAPVSTYGASKLAGEALISSYCAMFGLMGCVVSIRKRRRAPSNARCRIRLPAPTSRRRLQAHHPGRRFPVQVLHPRKRRDRRGDVGGAIVKRFLIDLQRSDG